jgi:RNA polymerase sigma-70 factor (ECF subfamily)
LQEVFIKAYTKINSYNSDYWFSSWIYRIAHNHTIDYFKKNSKKETINLEWDDDNINFLNLYESDENIEKNLFWKELNEKIWEIINSLDTKYRDILILKFLEEKNYREISDILKIPEWTVATLINRWKKQFKQKAEEQKLVNYL